MKRPYKDIKIKEDVRAFVGVEVENTPCRDLTTLFIVGIQPMEDIMTWYKKHECEHIYFGANMSFDLNHAEKFIEMCRHTTSKDIWTTLDLEISDISCISSTDLAYHSKFVPQLSVRLPGVDKLGIHATIKIDDTGFNENNPGVWCAPLKRILQPANETLWINYGKDKVIK
ncbi:MAG: hypothetical protein CMO97_03950 [Woeseia sp.]|nr:hypothetical protein [Woeseia sp.]